MDDKFILSPSIVEIAPNLFVSRASDDVGDSVSYPEEFFEQNQADLSNFWISRRNRNIERVLHKHGKSTLLEIGSGNGAVARYLANKGFSIKCVEPHMAGAIQTANFGIHTLVSTTPSNHLHANSQEAIGIFDVLEHVDSEQSFLIAIRDLMQPGGILVVTVPTGNWLFSDVDKALGHFRRYSRKRLRRVMNNAGFDEVGSNYMFMLLVLVALVFRVVPYRLGFRRNPSQQLQMIGDALDSKTLASQIVGLGSRIEALFDRFNILPYGLSIIGVYTTQGRVGENCKSE